MAVSTIINQILVLVLLLSIGYVLARFGIINKSGSDQLTTILCYIVLPCVIFSSFQTEFRANMLHNFVVMCMIAIGVHILNILVCMLIFNKKTIKDASIRNILRFSSIYSNTGFMGFPLLQSLAGTDGLFYGSAYNSIFGLFLWTHGFSLFSDVLDKKSMYKIVLNPNIIASIIGLLFYRFSITLPKPVNLTIGYLAQLNTALSMIVIGATMTQISLEKLYADVYIWIGVTIRNLVLPFTLLILLYIAGVRGELLLCSIIPAACPVAGFSVLFSKVSGKDVTFPCKLMALSTFASLLTIPLVLGVVSLI